MAAINDRFNWPVDPKGYQIDEALARIKGRGGKTELKRPLEIKDLYLDFARIRPSHSAEDCLAFANKWGLLGQTSHDARRLGENLDYWLAHSTPLRAAIQCLQAGDTSAVENLIFIGIEGRLRWDEREKRLKLIISPVNLVSAIYFQFAQAVNKGITIKNCDHCGEWFEAGGEVRRLDARFCTDRCRLSFNKMKARG